MIMTLVDVHAHINFPSYKNDADETIKRAFKNGVSIINVGTGRLSSQRAVEMAHNHPDGLWATVGHHPTEKEEFDGEFYEKLAVDRKVVAIGECGLDYYRASDSRARQKEIFIQHIELAKKVSKPLMIHCRDAFGDLIEILTFYVSFLNVPPGAIHFFTGTKKDAAALLNMGFYFTFGGLITFNRDFDEVIKFLPLEKILLETDSPFVAPTPYRGERNEPSYIVETAKKMAELKGTSFEEIAEKTTVNAKLVFAL